jgi:exodeoxyribonuclease VII large subunit
MPEIPATHNIAAYSVSEIANALKRVVEDNFGQVSVRGEISGFRGPHSSGHAYFRLKDDKAVLEAVCWRGTMGKLSCRLEEGLEVIATGRITTYPGSSKYQIVIERMEAAGAGALMALLEKRKAMLAAEGLFDAASKKPLPFMPRVIGVVTSPTGAVIRDILHRLSERFPCHVLVWPVAVQGEGAAEQIAAAIDGFNAFNGTPLPRPDLLIVARGGGSLEDLWAFNEEIVVRAAAASHIPLISAVGHETDTTLIDYASDLRAPTPTAAAEIAVPVREEWRLGVMDQGQRLYAAWSRSLQRRTDYVTGLARGLLHPGRLIETMVQKLDDRSERLAGALPAYIASKEQRLALAAAKLHPATLLQHLLRQQKDIATLGERAERMAQRRIADSEQRLKASLQLLESLDYRRVLERGYTLLRTAEGRLVSRVDLMQDGKTYQVQFYDGTRLVTPSKT